MCQDGQVLAVGVEAARKSVIINDIIEEGNDGEEIPVQVNKDIMEKVIEFCVHIGTAEPPQIDKPLTSTDLSQLGVDEWYINYISVDKNTLFEIVMAANYLNIPSLLELSSAAVAAQMKGQSVDFVRDYFEVQNDFTEEELAQI